MPYKKIILLCLLVMLFTSCSESVESGNHGQLRPEHLFGEWRNEYMRLEMKSYGNSDSTHVFEVQRHNWEEKLNIRPIRTFFRPDFTYNSMHLNLNDSLIFNPAGNWMLRHDSIIMTDTFPEKGISYRYHVKLNNDSVVFTGIEDLDGDGNADDHYFGIQRRYR